MSADGISEVVEILVSKGRFRQTPEPLHVADTDFEFDAVLVGPTDEARLVLVVDDESASLAALRARVRALAAVLEGTGSRRPLTAIIVGEGVADAATAALEEVCRVIVVPKGGDVETSLRTLLPLDLPQPYEAQVSADEALRRELGDLAHDPLVQNLLAAGSKTAAEVESRMRDAIDKASVVPDADEEEPDD